MSNPHYDFVLAVLEYFKFDPTDNLTRDQIEQILNIAGIEATCLRLEQEKEEGEITVFWTCPVTKDKSYSKIEFTDYGWDIVTRPV